MGGKCPTRSVLRGELVIDSGPDDSLPHDQSRIHEFRCLLVINRFGNLLVLCLIAVPDDIVVGRRMGNPIRLTAAQPFFCSMVCGYEWNNIYSDEAHGCNQLG